MAGPFVIFDVSKRQTPTAKDLFSFLSPLSVRAFFLATELQPNVKFLSMYPRQGGIRHSGVWNPTAIRPLKSKGTIWKRKDIHWLRVSEGVWISDYLMMLDFGWYFAFIRQCLPSCLLIFEHLLLEMIVPYEVFTPASVETFYKNNPDFTLLANQPKWFVPFWFLGRPDEHTFLQKLHDDEAFLLKIAFETRHWLLPKLNFIELLPQNPGRWPLCEDEWNDFFQKHHAKLRDCISRNFKHCTDILMTEKRELIPWTKQLPIAKSSAVTECLLICTQCRKKLQTTDPNETLCKSCKRKESINQKIEGFVCDSCGSKRVIKRGFKLACFEGDPKNYRKRKFSEYVPHGELLF